MSFKSRKLVIWFISLVVVFAIYLLYIRLTETPQLQFHTGAPSSDSFADPNAGQFGSEIGKISGVGVGKVEMARFVDLNERTKEVEREWGFEKLRHEQGNEWEMEKPFMDIFRKRFKCSIKADKGNFLLESGVEKPTPRQAAFTGNVVVHISPRSGSDIQEGFIYLDDVVFTGEKSLFSSVGPVKFVSKDAEMLGRGLELVYDDQADRLEFIRIINLESLHLKTSSQAGLFAGATTSGGFQAKPAEYTAPDGQKPEPTPATSREGLYYKCVFTKNVVIDTAEQLVRTDVLSINDIFWPKGSSKGTAKADTAAATTAKPGDVPAADSDQPNELPEEFVDIVVTCDGGILVTLVDSNKVSETSVTCGGPSTKPETKRLIDFNDVGGKAVLVADRIDYSAPTGDTVASGLPELVFPVNDVLAADSNEPAVPVTITAREKATFSPVSNQAVFEGDCQCTMLRADPNGRHKYTLSAPKLTVDLARTRVKQPSGIAHNIKHLSATGGTVRLSTINTKEEELLGGIELKCRRFDFDTAQQLCLAAGPGVIKVDNSRIPEPNSQPDRFSLRKPCWAIIENFQTLKYFLQTNQLIADAGSQGPLNVNYFPIVKGQVRYDQQVVATASHVEALLYETANRQFELSTLIATGGVTYEDEDKQFAGSKLFYDHNKSLITVQGDQFQPCLLNGVLVDGIEYYLKTGKLKKGKITITGPGVLQMK